MDTGMIRGAAGGLISSLCCLGSLVLLLIGAGNLSLAASIGAYRTYFIIAGVLFILLSIASHLRRKAKQCACSYRQLIGSERKFIATTLLTYTAIFGVISFALIPYVTAVISESSAKTELSSESELGELRELKLKVDGMTCESCAEAIERSLMQVNGIVKADVSYAEGKAVVVYDPSTISRQGVVESVPEPYAVEVLSDRVLD
jgi:copper chaperone CopZ